MRSYYNSRVAEGRRYLFAMLISFSQKLNVLTFLIGMNILCVAR